MNYLRRFGVHPVIPIPIDPRQAFVPAVAMSASIDSYRMWLICAVMTLRLRWSISTGFAARGSDRLKRCKSILRRKSKGGFRMSDGCSLMFRGTSSRGCCFRHDRVQSDCSCIGAGYRGALEDPSAFQDARRYQRRSRRRAEQENCTNGAGISQGVSWTVRCAESRLGENPRGMPAVSRVVGVLGRIEPNQRIESSMHMR